VPYRGYDAYLDIVSVELLSSNRVSSPKPVSRGGEPVDPAPKPTRPSFTAQYRDKISDEYRDASHGEKSVVLRREGLYQSQIAEWTQAPAARPAVSQSAVPADPATRSPPRPRAPPRPGRTNV
jgi:hypothetical protein